MTLIELLVVIIILTTLVAAAIPLLSPTNDDRRLREATRGVNTFITGAQTRAIALAPAVRRRAQAALARHEAAAEDNGVCLEVFYVEQQPPYAGFDATRGPAWPFIPIRRHGGPGAGPIRARAATYQPTGSAGGLGSRPVSAG